MAKFEVGQRVSIYGAVKPKNVNEVSFLRGKRGTVIDSPFEPGEVNIKTDDNWVYTAHPKQLRRLRPRKNRVAREVWISDHMAQKVADTGKIYIYATREKLVESDRLFREVLPEGGR